MAPNLNTYERVIHVYANLAIVKKEIFKLDGIFLMRILTNSKLNYFYLQIKLCTRLHQQLLRLIIVNNYI